MTALVLLEVLPNFITSFWLGQWSANFGLSESLLKCEVSAVGKRKTEDACQVFDPSRVSPAIRVLGAVGGSCSDLDLL